MTPHQIVATCSRLAALIWATYAMYRVPELFVHINHPAIDNRASVVFLTAIQLSVCLLLWIFPATVARMLLPLKEAANSTSPRLSDWQILGFVLVGVWETAQAFPRLIYWVIFLNTTTTVDQGFASLTLVERAQFFWAIAQLCVGIFLMLAARRLTTYLFGSRIN
jgi:hypothetical protein